MATRTWFMPGVGIVVEKDAGRTWFVPGGGIFVDQTAASRILPAAVVRRSAQRVADRAFVHKQSRQNRLPKSEM